MDFIIIDPKAKKILVTDCKYHRVRYEMVGFSHDYKNFKQEYEKKIEKKVKFIAEHLQLLQEHFKGEGKLGGLDITGFEVEALFIVNTPTFYMFNGKINTMTVGHLDEFIKRGYKFPELLIKPHDQTQPKKNKTSLFYNSVKKGCLRVNPIFYMYILALELPGTSRFTNQSEKN